MSVAFLEDERHSLHLYKSFESLVGSRNVQCVTCHWWCFGAQRFCDHLVFCLSLSSSSYLRLYLPNDEHSRTVKNYVHMCEGRLSVQVRKKKRIKTCHWALVEDWSSADAALEGIKRWCCYCRDRQGVPEAHCVGEERVLVGVHGAVWYQESDPMTSNCCSRVSQVMLGRNAN